MVSLVDGMASLVDMFWVSHEGENFDRKFCPFVFTECSQKCLKEVANGGGRRTGAELLDEGKLDEDVTRLGALVWVNADGSVLGAELDMHALSIEEEGGLKKTDLVLALGISKFIKMRHAISILEARYNGIFAVVNCLRFHILGLLRASGVARQTGVGMILGPYMLFLVITIRHGSLLQRICQANYDNCSEFSHSTQGYEKSV